MENIKFPKGFMWGTAASAYQAEGGNNNADWYIYETLEMKKKPERRKIKEPCGPACDHWNRYNEDFTLAGRLGIQVHRLSIEWSRVYPEPGVISHTALRHYEEMLASLRKRKIKVMLCLSHFTLPRWCSAKGGYVNPDYLLVHFREYVETIVQNLGGYIDYWLPINEPNIVPLGGYLTGEFPPFRKNFIRYVAASRTIFHMHAVSFELIKNRYPAAPVGVAFAYMHFQPFNRDSLFDREGAKIAHRLANEAFFHGVRTGRAILPFGIGGEIKGLKDSLDFIGVNYYTTTYMKNIIPVKSKPADLITDMGWICFPEGLNDVLMYLHGNTDKPIIITENGVATTDESFRIAYMDSHLRQVHKAITCGIPVQGYMCWSLTDNFEWHLGFDKRFGLIHIDYTTQKRTIKKGGTWFAGVIKNNSL